MPRLTSRFVKYLIWLIRNRNGWKPWWILSDKGKCSRSSSWRPFKSSRSLEKPHERSKLMILVFLEFAPTFVCLVHLWRMVMEFVAYEPVVDTMRYEFNCELRRYYISEVLTARNLLPQLILSAVTERTLRISSRKFWELGHETLSSSNIVWNTCSCTKILPEEL